MRKKFDLKTGLLTKILNKNNQQGVIGDFEEQFQQIKKDRGLFFASLWYWGQIFYSLPSLVKNFLIWNLILFGNYSKLAARSLTKNKFYSTIHIFGFATALSVVLLLFLYVIYETSADKFHKNYNHIYRLQTPKSAGLSPQFAEILQENFPEIEKVTRINHGYGKAVVNYNQPLYIQNIIFVDESFFDVFSFETVLGDLKTAMTVPASIVLTEQEKDRIFGDENPIGKVLKLNGGFLVKVTAVIKNVPKNSSLNFSCVLPIQFLNQFSRRWDDISSTNFNHYFLCQNQLNVEEFGTKVKKYFNEKYQGWFLDQKYEVIPFGDVYFNQTISDSCRHGNSIQLLLLVGIGLLILIVALINFINLSIAKSAKRFMEIGVRKVIGANRNLLIWQFLTEAIFICLIAIGIALILVDYFIPEFNQLFRTNISLGMISLPQLIMAVILLGGFLGVLSGIYPSFYVTRFQTVQVMRGEQTIHGNSGLFKKGLLIFQFVVSVILIVCTLVIGKQRSFMQNQDLGFNKKNSLILNYTQRISEPFKQELKQHPNISQFVLADGAPGHGVKATDTEWTYKGIKKDIRFLFNNVDTHFLGQMGFTLKEGRFFSEEMDKGRPVCIINETAIKDFEIDNYNEAYFDIYRDDGEPANPAQVIGVVKDFNHESLHSKIEPFVFFYNPNLKEGYPILKIRTENYQTLQQTISHVEKVWKKYYAGIPLEYHFLDDYLDNLYRQEADFARIFTTFSALAIIIACMGLLGLVSFITDQRTKEIGIRKVFGASISNITGMLTFDFIKWVLIANLIAWPIAWYVMNQWLQNFAYRTDLTIYVFLSSGAIVCGISILTVYFKAIKAATKNPIQSIHYE